MEQVNSRIMALSYRNKCESARLIQKIFELNKDSDYLHLFEFRLTRLITLISSAKYYRF